MIQLVTDPDRFYRSAGSGAVPLGPVAVVTLGALPLVFRDVLFAMQAPSAGVGAIGAVVNSFLTPFLIWVTLAALFYWLSLAFDGEGGFRRTLRYVGWGFLPTVISSTLVFAAAVTVAAGVTGAESLAALQRQVEAAPLYRLFDTSLSPVFMFWSGFLWTFAVRHARGLSLREAAVSVWIPVGAVIALMVVG